MFGGIGILLMNTIPTSHTVSTVAPKVLAGDWISVRLLFNPLIDKILMFVVRNIVVLSERLLSRVKMCEIRYVIIKHQHNKALPHEFADTRHMVHQITCQ